MTFPTEVTIPLLKDVKSQAPKAVCVVEPNNVSTNIIVNSSAPPFDNLDIRRALALALDRKAFVSIMFEGQADIGGTMQPGPAGLWAMPKEMLETIPGYGPNIEANRAEARKLMQKAETDLAKRKKLTWEIDKKLQEDVARPIIFHSRSGTCWQPYVRGITVMCNSSYNGYRYEDVWLDK